LEDCFATYCNVIEMVTSKGLEYRLEKSSPGSSLDLDSSLGVTRAREFVLVRENSKYIL
jgi:hypothetical protein